RAPLALQQAGLELPRRCRGRGEAPLRRPALGRVAARAAGRLCRRRGPDDGQVRARKRRRTRRRSVTLVVVSAPIAAKARNGGIAWIPLSYVRGLRRLGCEVWFIEEIEPGDDFEQCVAYFCNVMATFGL